MRNRFDIISQMDRQTDGQNGYVNIADQNAFRLAIITAHKFSSDFARSLEKLNA